MKQPETNKKEWQQNVGSCFLDFPRVESATPSTFARPKRTKQNKHKKREGSQSQRMTLEITLSIEYGFTIFMDHLMTEFSAENMLSLLEITQFQQMLSPHRNTLFNLPTEGIFEDLKSSIVFDKNLNISQKYNLLYGTKMIPRNVRK